MIDYEKLKLAHELADLLCLNYMHFVTISCNFSSKLSLRYELNLLNFECEYVDIDSLITKLQELSNPVKLKPKYKVGQEVWYINRDDDIESFVIDKCSLDANQWIYEDSDRYSWLVEHQLYLSREDLIESQIEHWQNMRTKESVAKCLDESLSIYQSVITDTSTRTNKQEFPYNSTAQLDMLDNVRKIPRPNESDCKHVSNGKVYLVNSILDDDALSKCKECGEFYK